MNGIINKFRLSAFLKLFFAFVVSTSLVNATTLVSQKSIIGEQPYITINELISKGTKSNDLLAISYKDPDGNVIKFNAETDQSNSNSPLSLPYNVANFSQIKMIVPDYYYSRTPKAGVTQSMTMADLIKSRDAIIGGGAGSMSGKGHVEIKITNNKGQIVPRTEGIKADDAPYSISISLVEAQLETVYGNPKLTKFDDKNYTFYVKPYVTNDEEVVVKNIEVNLSSNLGNQPEWESEKGFVKFSLADIEQNFPKTGFDGAYYNLVLNAPAPNITIEKVTTNSSVDLEKNVNANGANSHKVRLKLNGPNIRNKKEFVPTTFKIYSDTQKQHLIYEFKIDKWFIIDSIDGDVVDSYNACAALPNFKMPSVNELTNASGYGHTSLLDDWESNNFARMIGKGGLFAEWGDISKTSTNIISQNKFWTKDYKEGGFYVVKSENGEIELSKNSPKNYTLCVSNGELVSTDNQTGWITLYAQPELSKQYVLDANIWVNDKGFIVNDPVNTSANFPKTAFDGAQFDLITIGNEITNPYYESDNNDITLEISQLSVITRKNTDKSNLRIKIKGPNILKQKEFKSTKFEIYTAQDKKNKIYSFEISKWFIVNKNEKGGFENNKAFCNRLPNYRMAYVGELTNAHAVAYDWTGITNSLWKNNTYARDIGFGVGSKTSLSGRGSLLGEWGDVTAYKESEFQPGYYWTNNAQSQNSILYVDSSNGAINAGVKLNSFYSICVSDGNQVEIDEPQLKNGTFAQPNMSRNGGKTNVNRINGPDTQWDFVNGFKMQSIDSPSANFPTVGAHGLKFNINGRNLNPSYSTDPDFSTISLRLITSADARSVTVELNGPQNATDSSRAEVTLPTTFTIYSDNAQSVPLYSFTITKWFMFYNENATSNFNDVITKCSSIGYRVPNVNDLTNANGEDWTKGLSEQPNNYQRRIHNGLLPEWGSINDGYYERNGFSNTSSFIWTNDKNEAGNRLTVDASAGWIKELTNTATPAAIACLKDSIKASASYVKPRLENSYSNQTEWDESLGFSIKDSNNAANNFPKTGFDKAYFDLTIENGTNDNVLIERISGSTNVNAEIQNIPNYSLKNKVRIVLSGPTETNLGNEFEPSTFVVYSDRTKKLKIYSFTINKWFIASSTVGSLIDAKTYCDTLPNYRVPNLRELTNATHFDINPQLPGWSDNTYSRSIGDGSLNAKGGLLPEWGNVLNYDNSNFKDNFYWSKGFSAKAVNNHIGVNFKNGSLTDKVYGDQTLNFLCISNTENIKPTVNYVSVDSQSNLGDKAEWQKNKGFIVKSLDDSKENFPKTAFDKAYFDLITNDTTESYIYERVSGSSLIDLTLIPKPNGNDINALRISISGPNESNPETFEPTEFAIYSGPNKKHKVYSFKITKWFISIPQNASLREAALYCRNLPNYRLPEINELTNAAAYDIALTNNWENNTFAREIGDGNKGGLFAEWGNILIYSDSNLKSDTYWTNTFSHEAPNKFINVSGKNGSLGDALRSTVYSNTLCVSDGNVVPQIKYSKPELLHSEGEYASTEESWSQNNGFVADATSSFDNFPTTAANNLYFNVIIDNGVDGLTWDDVTIGGITASISNVTKNSITVTLKGPTVNKDLDKIILPAYFELKGKKDDKIFVKYKFTIKEWFVHSSGTLRQWEDAVRFCYDLPGGMFTSPTVSQLTNANGLTDDGQQIPFIGDFNNSSGLNQYKRIIGGGFFAEWGYPYFYANADFPENMELLLKSRKFKRLYATKDKGSSKHARGFYVNHESGSVTSDFYDVLIEKASPELPYAPLHTICVSNGIKVNVPAVSPRVLFVTPENINDKIGSAPEWNNNYGYDVINVNNPSSNFPRTGFNNASFRLKLADTNSDLITVEKEFGSDSIDVALAKEAPHVVNLTLTGPTESNQTNFKATQFSVYSTNNNVKTKIYSFKITKWFIASSHTYKHSKAKAFCFGLANNFRLALANELTNATAFNITGAPLWSNNTYARSIGDGNGDKPFLGGLFAEWGGTEPYTVSKNNLNNANYWTNTNASEDDNFILVNSSNGQISSENEDEENKAICVSEGEQLIFSSVKLVKPLSLEEFGNSKGFKTGFKVGKGFEVQNYDIPTENFPKTGFNNATFDLKVENIDVGQIQHARVSGSNNVDLELSSDPMDATILRVKLIGPHELSPTEFKPTSFVIYYINRLSPIYTFKIEKWFMPVNEVTDISAAKSKCSEFAGYRLPDIGELTNASNSALEWSGTLSGWTGNTYLRAIGDGILGIESLPGKGGLFPEWGDVQQYQSGFGNDYYWTTGYSNFGNYNFISVHSADGGLYSTMSSFRRSKVLCVSDGKPSSLASVRYARPGMVQSESNSNIWNPSQGFRITDPDVPVNKLPTTAFNNAFFDLIVTGETTETVSQKSETENSEHVSIELIPAADGDRRKLRVWIKGPSALNPNDFKPSTFHIFYDKDGKMPMYSFKINKWYIASPTKGKIGAAVNYCNSLPNYRIPEINELSNATFSDAHIAGATNWIHNKYARNLESLFAEWGAIRQYPQSGFVQDSYWSAGFSKLLPNKFIEISSESGKLQGSEEKIAIKSVVCVNDSRKLIPTSVISVKPNILNDESNQDEWNKTKGFSVIDKDKPDVNFPKTGFNKASFDLLLKDGLAAGVVVDRDWGSENVSVSLSIPEDPRIVRLTLNGPSDANQTDFAPTQFSLYSDSSRTNKIYSFKLTKWFIASTVTADISATRTYCYSLPNYRLPLANELTNATGYNQTLTNWTNDYAARAIGDGSTSTFGRGGLFAEWGTVNYEPYDMANSNIHSAWYWSNSYLQNQNKYIKVFSDNGKLGDAQRNDATLRTLCVSDGNVVPKPLVEHAVPLDMGIDAEGLVNWDVTKGFSNVDKDAPANNFPRTGFNNAQFNMTVKFEVNEDLHIVKDADGSPNVNASLTKLGRHEASIVLTGPTEQNNVEFKPTTFTIYVDKAETLKVYSFTLTKWFISSTRKMTLSNAQNYCLSLNNYRLPEANELTNSSGFGKQYVSDWNKNKYARAIGDGSYDLASNSNGGLLSEWGDVSKYSVSNTNFSGDIRYWTRSFNQTNTYKFIDIDIKTGEMGDAGVPDEQNRFEDRKVVCVSDGNQVNPPAVNFVKPKNTAQEGNSPDWDLAKGFKTINVNEAWKNFPRTGFDNAYFEVTVDYGISQGVNIVKNYGSSEVNAALAIVSQNVVSVTLSGPTDSNSVEFKPTEFTIYADTERTRKVYSFKITKWFISSPNGMTLSKAQIYCFSLPNYRLADTRELTNASRHDIKPVGDYGDNRFVRAVGDGNGDRAYNGGLFSEWGVIGDYKNDKNNFDPTVNMYWVRTYSSVAANKFMDVNSNDGWIGDANEAAHFNYQKAACVSDGNGVPKPVVNYAKPNSMRNVGNAPNWNGNNGFRNVRADYPDKNFPRTGFDYAQFRITVENAISQGITIVKENDSEVNAEIYPEGANVAVVTLRGPREGWNKPFIPTTFTIYSDNNKTYKLYSFKLSKWFISSVSNMNLSYAQGYCWKFDNYRLAKVGEITNASEHEYSPVTYWKRNESARAIGDGSDGGAGVNEYYGGLVPEWGDLGFYTSSISNFSSDTWYWSGAFSNVASNKYIDINSTTGVIGNTSHNTEHQKALCVSDGNPVEKFGDVYVKPTGLQVLNTMKNWNLNAALGYKVAPNTDINLLEYGFHNASIEMLIQHGIADAVYIEKEYGSPNVSASITSLTQNKVRVLITGPHANWPARFSPTKFNIYSDRAKSIKLYSFEVKYWVIGSTYSMNQDGAASYCRSLNGYFMLPNNHFVDGRDNERSLMGLMGNLSDYKSSDFHDGGPYWSDWWNYVYESTNASKKEGVNRDADKFKALCVSTGANTPKFTFAKPGNMEPNRAASDDLWDTSNGHKRRVEFWHYAQNFPSTAAHGLYFSLLKTDGGDNDQIEIVRESGGANIGLDVQVNNRSETKLIFTGQNRDGGNQPELPARFRIYLKNKDGFVTDQYAFNIQKWFVDMGNINQYEMDNCNKLPGSYSRAIGTDLTNVIIKTSNYCTYVYCYRRGVGTRSCNCGRGGYYTSYDYKITANPNVNDNKPHTRGKLSEPTILPEWGRLDMYLDFYSLNSYSKYFVDLVQGEDWEINTFEDDKYNIQYSYNVSGIDGTGGYNYNGQGGWSTYYNKLMCVLK